MKDRIKIAVVDATHEDDARPDGPQWPSRYVTSVANLPLLAQVVRSLADDGIEQVLVVTPDTMCQTLRPVVQISDGLGREFAPSSE